LFVVVVFSRVVYAFFAALLLLTPKKSETFTKALETVDASKATGKTHLLWIAYSQFWESLNKLPEARRV
jgi:hypothetical protein